MITCLQYGNRCDLVGRARLLFNVNLDQINEEYVTLMDRNKVPVEGIGTFEPKTRKIGEM